MTYAGALQKSLALLVPALLFGFLVTAQWITFAGPAARDVEIRYIDPLAASVTELQGEQTDLRAQIGLLRDRLDEARRRGAAQVGQASDLQGRIADLRGRAGLTAVVGEGSVITLDAARSPAGAAGSDRPPCLAPDLTDIVNAGWRAGAVAIAVGPERMVGSSSVYCVGATIVVNGSILAGPYEIRLVGDSARLLSVLNDPAELRDLKRRREERSVVFDVAGAAAVSVPAYTGVISTRAAAPR